MTLFYGQIRRSNYVALRKHYGHEPPWPMERSPHISLVEAVRSGANVYETSYWKYIEATHGPLAHESMTRQRDVVELLLGANVLDVEMEHQSVSDGNHRVAVHLVTKKRLQRTELLPYQTLIFPDEVVPGRRPKRLLEYDFTGRTVADIGCAHGMASIDVIFRGAKRAFAFDHELRSTTWLLRNAWGMQSEIEIRVCDASEIEIPSEVDLVLALSVRHHIGENELCRLIEGRDCLLETHHEGETPPNTEHVWRRLCWVPYSVSEPGRRRAIYEGRVLGARKGHARSRASVSKSSS